MIDRTVGCFQHSVKCLEWDSLLKPSPEVNLRSGNDPMESSSWALLADTALRMELLTCSEATSEKTNGRVTFLHEHESRNPNGPGCHQEAVNLDNYQPCEVYLQ
jgi:hypothetical protein